MSHIYTAGVAAGLGIALYYLLYFVIKEAVQAGITSALHSMDTSESMGKLIETAVARGMGLDRKSGAFDEEQD